VAERIYSESEAAAILERAARRQGVEDPGATVGLTLSELESVASSAGIAPANVAAAAAELAAAAPDRRATVVGLQSEATRTRLLAGPVSDEAWGSIVAMLRREFGATGVTSDVGAVRAWASAASENEVPVRVSLEPEGAGARLTIAQSPGDLVAVLTMMTVGVATILGLLTLLSADSAIFGVAALAVPVAIYLGVRIVYARSMRRTEARFEAALHQAATLVEPSAAGAARHVDTMVPGARFEISSEDPNGEPGRTAGRRTRT
jgi:hypothetical protein